MEGRLDENGQPVIPIRLFGAADPVALLIDTGFDGDIILHHEHLVRAGIDHVYQDMERVRLVDGSEVTLLLTRMTIEWHGEPRRVTIGVVPRPAPPSARGLLGCALLRDSRLTIDFPAGAVRIIR